MGQGWCSRAGRGGVGARGASSVVQLKLRRGAAESPAPTQVEHRGGLRAGAAGAKGRRRDRSDAAGVWPGAAETGSTRLVGDAAGDGGGGRTLESHPLFVFLPLFGRCGCVRTKG